MINILNSYSFIYWVNTLDALKIMTIVADIILGIAILVLIICYIEECDVETKDSFRHVINILSPILAFSILFSIFVPSKKQFYEIYGIGGTIEYIKNNPKAQQLPDKTINALDKYLDSISDTTNTNKN